MALHAHCSQSNVQFDATIVDLVHLSGAYTIKGHQLRQLQQPYQEDERVCRGSERGGFVVAFVRETAGGLMASLSGCGAVQSRFWRLRRAENYECLPLKLLNSILLLHLPP